MKMLEFLSIILLFMKACDGLDERFIKNVIDSVYDAAQDEPKLRQQLFLTAVWPEISGQIPKSLKIPGFIGNVGMTSLIYADETNISPNVDDIFLMRFENSVCKNCVEAVFDVKLYFKKPVNFVIHNEDSLGEGGIRIVSYRFNGQNMAKFWMRIPDFSQTRDKIPLECVVYIDAFDIEFLSSPTIDENKLKDDEAEKLVKQFWDIVKQGDIQRMMRIGIMKAMLYKLYPEASRTITVLRNSNNKWACVGDEFIDDVLKDARDYSNIDEDTDDEFQVQIEYMNSHTDEDRVYEKINISEFIGPLQLAIDKSINFLSSQPKRDIHEGDYMNTHQISFTSAMAEMRTGQPEFTFITYAPIIFRHLRQIFGFTEDNFVSSFCKVPLTELLNPGKSGSGLYLSQDQYFIAKTVQKVEAEFLQAFLSKYYDNIQQNPDTLLPKLFGFYEYKQSSQINLRLFVMNNIMPPSIKIDRKYDLKGSLYQREVSEENKNKPSVTFKDLDFLNHHQQGIYLKAKDYKRLMNTIESDCTILQHYQVIDYSLLLGLHYEDGLKGDGKVPVVDEDSLPCEPVFTKELSSREEKIQNGILAWTANGEKVVLFVGIIDMLQSYRLTKRLEHYWKSVIYAGKEFSVVDPEHYTQRFKNFMDKKVFKKMLPCLAGKSSLKEKSHPQLHELFAAHKPKSRPTLSQLLAAGKLKTGSKLGELLEAGRKSTLNYMNSLFK